MHNRYREMTQMQMKIYNNCECSRSFKTETETFWETKIGKNLFLVDMYNETFRKVVRAAGIWYKMEMYTYTNNWIETQMVKLEGK